MTGNKLTYLLPHIDMKTTKAIKPVNPLSVNAPTRSATLSTIPVVPTPKSASTTRKTIAKDSPRLTKSPNHQPIVDNVSFNLAIVIPPIWFYGNHSVKFIGSTTHLKSTIQISLP